MTAASSRRGKSLLVFAAAVAVTLAAAVSAYSVLMQPGPNELLGVATLLGSTALLALAVGYGARRLGWILRSPRLSWTLLSGYVVASLLTFLSVWVTARLMFVSQHDLIMATILLIFAAGIAMSLGYYLSTSITESLQKLRWGARLIAAGQLGARVSVVGRDEVAELSRSFNEMASRLEDAARRQRELDTLRRDLIAWVGHDLRTPLSSIRAMAEALSDGLVQEPEKVERYLSTMERDIGTLSVLIDDLFELAQVDAGGLVLDLAPVSVEELLTDTVSRFAERARSGEVEITSSTSDELDLAPLDRHQIDRVMDNLVENALRHTPPGGRVEISARKQDQRWALRVSDTGSGIPKEDLPHIFDRFYRSEKSRSRATGGSGLGLAIAKGIVEAHGGQIDAESGSGEGTSITLVLPLG